MKSTRVKRNGFTWAYYASKTLTKKALLLMMGNSDHDTMVKACAKYMTGLGVGVAAIAPNQDGKPYSGCHSFPLECLEEAIQWLREQGMEKVGMAGGSTTGMLCLAAAAHLPDLSLVLAYTPSDHVMQGFFKGKKDGHIPEWPAPGESTMTYRGKPLPYAPFQLSDEDYYNLSYGKATKDAGELSGRALFAHVEACGIPEEAYIPVEQIRGKIVFFGAEDDTLWDTVKYIRRMEARLKAHDFPYNYEVHTYRYGTHFVFPQGVFLAALPAFAVNAFVGKMFKSAKAHPKECQATRMDVDRATRAAIENW